MDAEKNGSISDQYEEESRLPKDVDVKGLFDSILGFTHRNKIQLILIFFAFLITSLTCIHYTIVLLQWTDIGFTLDDSWIHLEYARSIFENRAWEYSHGYPSTGSTSPLWSIVLSPLFFFTTDYRGLVWGVFLVSGILYSLSTYLVGFFVNKHSENLWIGIMAMGFFVIVPRNTWLMLSGMEYPLFLFLMLLPLYLIEKSGHQYDALLGVVAGLTFLTRPEGAVLAIVVFIIRIAQHVGARDFTKKRFVSLLSIPILAGLIVLPWILYCLSTTGYPLPDTFYAKVGTITEEHVEAWNIFWAAFISEMPFILTGALLGILTLMYKRPYPWFMAIGLFFLYRYTMPYQSLINNNRYVVPIHAFLAISCIVAFAMFANEVIKGNHRFNSQYVKIGLALSLIVLTFSASVPVYFNQANLFGHATQNINDMQVNIGLWVDENTPEDAVIALCDVGAIRFISNRTIVDLCGLVTPEITHGDFTSFELADYLESREIDYLIIFGKWIAFYNYIMFEHIEEIYRVSLPNNFISGDDEMVVFDVTW